MSEEIKGLAHIQYKYYLQNYSAIISHCGTRLYNYILDEIRTHLESDCGERIEVKISQGILEENGVISKDKFITEWDVTTLKYLTIVKEVIDYGKDEQQYEIINSFIMPVFSSVDITNNPDANKDKIFTLVLNPEIDTDILINRFRMSSMTLKNGNTVIGCKFHANTFYSEDEYTEIYDDYIVPTKAQE